MSFLKQHASRIVSGILLAFFVLSIVVSLQESTTMDERAHIPAGYSYVRWQDMRINPEHPPLLKDLAGLPLLLLHPAPILSRSDPLWESGDALDPAKYPEGRARTWSLAQWSFGDMILHQNGNDADAITFWARFPITLVALLLLFFVYRFTKELGGTLAGLFALLLFAADPNVIAHSHYVTTDIGIAAFIFISAYYFIRFLRDPSAKNIVLSGLFLALAELAKFSAVLLFPTYGLFVILYALTCQATGADATRPWRLKFRKLWEYLWKFAASVAIAFAVIWGLYFVNTLQMPGSVIGEIARAQFPNDKLAGRIAEGSVVWMSGVPILKPLAEYFLGLFQVFARVSGGNTYYFFGTVTNHATPWYFPAVFFLKETLPFLFLMFATGVYTLLRVKRSFAERGNITRRAFLARTFQNRIPQALALFFILFYAYVSITGNLNIGFRHLFPILPFLALLIGKTALDIYKRHAHEPHTRQTLGLILGGFSFAIVAIPVLAYPSYLSYFNAVAGGHTNGYHYVTDSNYDWGQDLKRLRDYVNDFNACKRGDMSAPQDLCRNPALPAIDRIRVDYFGGSDPGYYLGEKFIPWHSDNAPAPGWYAISVGFFQESTHRTLARPTDPSYRWLLDYAPVARAGDSIFIYYVPAPSGD